MSACPLLLYALDIAYYQALNIVNSEDGGTVYCILPKGRALNIGKVCGY